MGTFWRADERIRTADLLQLRVIRSPVVYFLA
jgi:hypothetical protein